MMPKVPVAQMTSPAWASGIQPAGKSARSSIATSATCTAANLQPVRIWQFSRAGVVAVNAKSVAGYTADLDPGGTKRLFGQITPRCRDPLPRCSHEGGGGGLGFLVGLSRSAHIELVPYGNACRHVVIFH